MDRVLFQPCSFASAMNYDDSNVYWQIANRSETAMATPLPITGDVAVRIPFPA
jgi:hypothetical protein